VKEQRGLVRGREGPWTWGNDVTKRMALSRKSAGIRILLTALERRLDLRVVGLKIDMEPLTSSGTPWLRSKSPQRRFWMVDGVEEMFSGILANIW
jgi:hypothetical protein